MLKAKVFPNGGSQAVRMPKAYRFPDGEVYANQVGESVVLTPVSSSRSALMAAAAEMFTDDFMEGVEDLPVQEREPF